MSGLDTLRARLEYQGGQVQEGRMQLGKLRTLKKAMLYSYQAATIIIDGNKFRCLMNTNKQKADYDCKILSIPYEDICLGTYNQVENVETGELEWQETFSIPDGKTSESLQETGIEPGKVFYWLETNTYWITYLKFLEEDAYFRGEVYKCENIPITINDNQYYVYIRGPVETEVQWNQKNNTSWNDINYSLIMYITKNEETLNYFHRFQKIDIPREDGNGIDTWEIKTVDPYSADGIIEVCLGEWFNNEFAETPSSEETDDSSEEPSSTAIYIDGPKAVQPYDTVTYRVYGLNNGSWEISNKSKAKFVSGQGNVINIEIISGKSGNFDLTYKTKTHSVSLPIEIKSI